jgi:hypothetical protein
VTAKENILAGLTRLLADGGMARSGGGAALLRTLQPLLDAGVVAAERSGAGRRLVVRDAAALRQFMERDFPNTPMAGQGTGRAGGVARFRDSKTFASDTPVIICVRAWTEEALLKDGQPAGAARASLEHGVFSFVMSRNYALRGLCALVENPKVFAQFERLRLPAGLVIRSGGGYVSQRLLDWLAGQGGPDFSLLHLPDYDPVGMTEFTRLRARLGERARLYLPENMAALFARFSSRGILGKGNNRAMLAALRKSKLPEVRRVVALIDSNNACLEQEALLLPAETI